MKNKLILTVILTLSATTSAITPAEQKIEDEKENMKILEKLGLPLPGSGIMLMPRSMLGLTDGQITKGEKEKAEAQSKGYVYKYSNRPKELMSVTPELVKKELLTSATKDMDSYTGFKTNVNQFKLAFTFPSVGKNKTLAASHSPVKIIAATPMGGFHKDLGGWSGAAEYFNVDGIGTCSYAVMNVKASKTAAQLAKEDVTYTINEKATLLKNVEGSDNSGYIYLLKWFDDKNFHELECANMSYSADINNLVIELARKIDRS